MALVVKQILDQLLDGNDLDASTMEALIGAIYLDLGLDAASQFVAPFLLNVHDTITQHEAFQDFKSQLQELVQKQFGCVPQYEMTDTVGPDHDKTFFVSAKVGDQILATGKGHRVKSAENRAAQAALAKLRIASPPSGG